MIKYKQLINQPPDDYSAIRLQSEDLKHLIPIPVNPDYRVSIDVEIMCLATKAGKIQFVHFYEQNFYGDFLFVFYYSSSCLIGLLRTLFIWQNLPLWDPPDIPQL